MNFFHGVLQNNAQLILVEGDDGGDDFTGMHTQKWSNCTHKICTFSPSRRKKGS